MSKLLFNVLLFFQCNSTVSCCTFLACSNANNTCLTDNTGFVVGTESLGETLENRFGEEEAEPVKLPTVPCLELGAKVSIIILL